jgi:hypothetical protein
MKITIEDKYSSKADPRRGYHDYECTVTFETDSAGGSLTEEGQKKWMDALWKKFQSEMGPGPYWLHQYGVKTKEKDKTVYHFFHGLDSGD